MLNGRRIVVGVTGGIAAYKAAELVSRLKKAGASVRCVMSANATRILPPLTLETLSGERCAVDQFDRAFEIGHISLAKWAELFVVAPATGNFLGKYACGIADDLITTTAMAVTCPVLLAPAMNSAMWKSPAVQENIGRLKERGVRTVGPETGHLACGDEDIGRMSEPAAIADACERILQPKHDLEGISVLVTAGPTVEYIDPVRYLTNRSTGKMGYALAEAARDRGASVTLISGPTALKDPAGIDVVRITSSAELCEAVLSRAAGARLVLQAAAPADLTPRTRANQKIKKTGEGLMLDLVPTTDIARELGRRKQPGQVLVAFAAETEHVFGNALDKLERKNADMIVANDVTRPGAGFAGDTNIVTLITREGSEELPLLSKRETAERILDRAAGFLG